MQRGRISLEDEAKNLHILRIGAIDAISVKADNRPSMDEWLVDLKRAGRA